MIRGMFYVFNTLLILELFLNNFESYEQKSIFKLVKKKSLILMLRIKL